MGPDKVRTPDDPVEKLHREAREVRAVETERLVDAHSATLDVLAELVRAVDDDMGLRLRPPAELKAAYRRAVEQLREQRPGEGW